MPQFAQPVIDIRRDLLQISEIKGKIITKIIKKNPEAQLGPYLSINDTEIPLALLLSLLRFIKHGKPLSLLDPDNPQPSNVLFRNCLDLITLSGALKLEKVQTELIERTLKPGFLQPLSAATLCQFSMINFSIIQIRYEQEQE